VRTIFYSLAYSAGTPYVRQWLRSIRSLRSYNRHIDVHLFLYNSAPSAVHFEADRQNVHVHFLGDYRDSLSRLSSHGQVLARYPTLHKFLSWSLASAYDVSQLLCLDCDTFFFADVDLLFETYSNFAWYAREEPGTSLCPFGRQPEHLDEDGLGATVRREAIESVIPFNSGVCLLNHGIWRGFAELKTLYLETAWRLLVGRHLAVRTVAALSPRERRIRKAVIADVDAFERSRAIPYPSTNDWIIEQISLWLTLGRLPSMSQGILAREHIMQGGEFRLARAPRPSWIVAHYFSSCETAFLRALARTRYWPTSGAALEQIGVSADSPRARLRASSRGKSVPRR
jgi:hypothetical protein